MSSQPPVRRALTKPVWLADSNPRWQSVVESLHSQHEKDDLASLPSSVSRSCSLPTRCAAVAAPIEPSFTPIKIACPSLRFPPTPRRTVSLPSNGTVSALGNWSDLRPMLLSNGKLERSFNVATAFTLRALLIKGVSHTNIDRTRLFLMQKDLERRVRRHLRRSESEVEMEKEITRPSGRRLRISPLTIELCNDSSCSSRHSVG